MKKVIISALPILLGLFLFTPVMASSNLEVSPNSDFSNQTLNYNVNQTIYVRLNSESSGDKNHILNLRDNQYNQLKSYNLSKNGNQFTSSFDAPSKEGYFSLEAKIESEGSLTTSVKTIKIGNPSNANVNVSIHNNVSGQTVLGNNTTTEPIAKESDNSRVAFQSSSTPKSDIKENSDITFSENTQPAQKKGFIYKVKIIFLKVASFFQQKASIIWPF